MKGRRIIRTFKRKGTFTNEGEQEHSEIKAKMCIRKWNLEKWSSENEIEKDILKMTAKEYPKLNRELVEPR